MSEYGDKVQAKCDAFADRVVKLNDYLLKQEGLKEEGGSKREKRIWTIWQSSKKNA